MKYFIIIFSLITISGCTTYNFGVQEEKYPHYFSAGKKNLNRVFKLNQKYSWLTRLPIGSEIIKVEHGVIATENDIKKLNIPDGRYIFSSIEFEGKGIQRAVVKLSSSGEQLKLIGTYIFRTKRDKNCRKDESNQNWEIQKLEGVQINEKCSFGLVNIYQVPDENFISDLIPKMFWFSSNIQQTIEITNSGKVYQFNFDLVWHKASSVWWKILTIT